MREFDENRSSSRSVSDTLLMFLQFKLESSREPERQRTGRKNMLCHPSCYGNRVQERTERAVLGAGSALVLAF